MSVEDVFMSLLRKAQGFHGVRTVGIGTATEIQDMHCTIIRDGAPDLYEVRLHAVDDTLNSFVRVYPKDGSYVIYALIDNSATDAVVIAVSEIDRTITRIGDTVHEITADGHTISKGADNMKGLLSDFITEVQKIIVVNGTSPDVAALEQIKGKFNNLLQ